MQWSSVLLPAPDGPTIADHLALVDVEVDAAQHLERAPHVLERLVDVSMATTSVLKASCTSLVAEPVDRPELATPRRRGRCVESVQIGARRARPRRSRRRSR